MTPKQNYYSSEGPRSPVVEDVEGGGFTARKRSKRNLVNLKKAVKQ